MDGGKSREMISDQKKQKVKEKAVKELKSYAIIATYLWVLFSMIEVHRAMVLRSVGQSSVSVLRIGFAAINALIIGKTILIGEDLHVGEGRAQKSPISSALFKSAVFALLVLCFEIIEEVIVGLIHGKSMVASIPRLGGGGLEGKVLYGVMAFVVLIPFFLFRELEQAIGEDKLHSLMLKKKPKADAA
jgi:hypothetical protein